jgi:Xaa-Pro dipeptidase
VRQSRFDIHYRYGFECSEPVLITDSGCETFIEFPQRLFVKD